MVNSGQDEKQFLLSEKTTSEQLIAVFRFLKPSKINYLLKNPNCPEEIRYQFLNSNSRATLRIIAEYTKDCGLLSILSNCKHYTVVDNVCKNPKTLSCVLDKILKEREVLASRQIAKNPNCPEWLMKKIVLINDFTAISSLLKNRNCNKTITEFIYKTSKAKNLKIMAMLKLKKEYPEQIGVGGK